MKKTGFTLIELLIVVLIIAILAAIAVPNFLEFQTRAKVSRAKSDMRSVATALEAYYVDNNTYVSANPFSYAMKPTNQNSSAWQMTLERITTPISYFSSLPLDPFPAKTRMDSSRFPDTTIPLLSVPESERIIRDQMYKYVAHTSEDSGDSGFNLWGDDTNPNWWTLQSHGPDQNYYNLGGIVQDYIQGGLETHINQANLMIYDPTNGTVSRGSVWRTGGSPTDPGSGLFKAITSAN